MVFRQMPQFKYARTGQERSIDFKIRIFCRRSNQNDPSFLHGGQQCILLRLIETVDLINEKNGSPSRKTQRITRFLHYGLDILFPRRDRIQLPEAGSCGIRDNPGQRGLSTAWRAVKNHRSQTIRLDRPIQECSLPYDLFLPHELFQAARPHPIGQRPALL